MSRPAPKLVALLVSVAICASSGFAARTAASPESITCTNYANRRVISVVRENDTPLPCWVRYQRILEGTDETPWRARRDPNFCTQQVNHLAQFLVNAGWRCDPAPEAIGDAPPMALRSIDRPTAEPQAAEPQAAEPQAAEPQAAEHRAAIDVAAPPVPVVEIPTPEAAPAAPPKAAPEPAPATTAAPAITREEQVLRSNTAHWIFARDKARLAADPRLRFYAGRYGTDVIAKALEVQALDLNEDGAPELFVRVGLEGACGDAPCRWRLYSVAPGPKLASLGIRGVREWRLLPTSTAGYRDLWLAVDSEAGDEMIARFVGSTGRYRRENAAAQAALPESNGGAIPQ